MSFDGPKTLDVNASNKKGDELSWLNPEHLIKQLLSNWYWLLLSILFSLSIAYLINRYSDRIYLVKSMLYFKTSRDAQEEATSMLFGQRYAFWYYNTLVDQQFMLKAYPLVEKTLKDLNLFHSFYGEGRIKTTELYSNPPALLTYTSMENFPEGKSYTFKWLDSITYSLKEVNENNTGGNGNYASGTEINLGAFRCTISKNPKVVLDPGVTYTLKFHRVHTLIENYRTKLDINLSDKEGRSNILTISTKGLHPEKEINFQERLAENFIEKSIEDKQLNANQTITFIDEQLVRLADTLTGIEDRLENFRSENSITGQLSIQGEKILDEVAGLQSQSAEVNLQLRYFDLIREYINGKADNYEALLVPSTLGIDDAVLNSLVADLIKLQRQRQLYSKGRDQSNPLAETKLRELESLRKEIIESLKNQERAADLQQVELNKRMKALEEEIKLIPGTERQLVNITRQYGFREKLYLLLLEKRTEASIKRAAMVPDVEVFEPARSSMGPISPNTKRTYILALAIGLFVPVGILLLAAALNNKIEFREQIEALSSMPILGVIGHEPTSNNLSIIQSPGSVLAESFRSVRVNLDFFLPDHPKKVLLISSGLSGEGKTFCSINLASVFALSGKKTVVIGADLRRPRLFQDFDLSNDIGLSNYLAGNVTTSELPQATQQVNLHLIGSGPVPPNPSELLMHPRMESLIEELKTNFDIIILDTPPVGLVSDALTLIPLSDLCIYVIRQNYTPRNSLKNAEEKYSQQHLGRAAILINDVALKKYGYYYGYSYDDSYYGDKDSKS